MDELEIKIVLGYKVPETDLTLNGILRGLEQDKNILMRSIVKAVLHALEEKAIEEHKIREPERYIRYGRRKRGRVFRTSFGEVRRIKGSASGKSTLYRRVQELAEKHGEWPSLKHRSFKFLMADGTKVELQEGRGSSVGQRAMRWAFACEEVEYVWI